MSLWALAHGLVLGCDTKGIESTLNSVTGVLALAANAAQSVRTIRILVALIGQHTSTISRCARHCASWATALVRSRGILTTCCGMAWVLGALIDIRASVGSANKSRRALALALGTAHFSCWAVLVRLTTGLAYSVMVADFSG